MAKENVALITEVAIAIVSIAAIIVLAQAGLAAF